MRALQKKVGLNKARRFPEWRHLKKNLFIICYKKYSALAFSLKCKSYNLFPMTATGLVHWTIQSQVKDVATEEAVDPNFLLNRIWMHFHSVSQSLGRSTSLSGCFFKSIKCQLTTSSQALPSRALRSFPFSSYWCIFWHKKPNNNNNNNWHEFSSMPCL